MFTFSFLVVFLTLGNLLVTTAAIKPVAGGFDDLRIAPEVLEDPVPPRPTNTPNARNPTKRPHPKNYCTDPIALVLGKCSSSTAISVSKRNNKNVITPLTKRAITTSTTAAATTCQPSDSACNYCALGFSEIAACASLLDEVGLDTTYLPDCLCYEATSETNSSVVWAPNYFDNAFASCPVFASTADKTDLNIFESVTGLCWGYGDYFAVETTDPGSYMLKIAAATSSVVSSGAALSSTIGVVTSSVSTGASTRAAASASTSTPTSTPQSSGSRGLHEYMKGPFQVLFAIPLFVALF